MSAEEGGLLGSQAIAQDYASRGVKVRAMLQMDMADRIEVVPLASSSAPGAGRNGSRLVESGWENMYQLARRHRHPRRTPG
jgi:Zn-dependent M28 family amino/carboxypeptidase